MFLELLFQNFHEKLGGKGNERNLGAEAVVGGTSLVAQWLRLWAPNVGALGSIPGQGTRSHLPQLRVRMLQLKIPRAATKNQRSQINK